MRLGLYIKCAKVCVYARLLLNLSCCAVCSQTNLVGAGLRKQKSKSARLSSRKGHVQVAMASVLTTRFLSLRPQTSRDCLDNQSNCWVSPDDNFRLTEWGWVVAWRVLRWVGHWWGVGTGEFTKKKIQALEGQQHRLIWWGFHGCNSVSVEFERKRKSGLLYIFHDRGRSSPLLSSNRCGYYLHLCLFCVQARSKLGQPMRIESGPSPLLMNTLAPA